MTYQSETLANSPLIYYRLDEASGAPANAGSLGGTGTVTGTLTRQQPAAGTIDGYSVAIPSGTAANNISQTIGTAPANWTIELWYKNNSGTSNSNLCQLARIQQTTGNYLALYYRPSDGYLRLYDIAGTMNGGPTGTTASNSLRDGNWHHIVVTRSGTNSPQFYIDGVSAGSTSGTSAAKTSATFFFGSNANETYNCYIDEPAFYPSVLTSTQIQAHYTTGTTVQSVSKTVQPPVMTSNSLSMPVPVVTATSPHKTVSAPVMTLSLSAPVPTFVGARASKTITAVAMSISLITPEASYQTVHKLMVTKDKAERAGSETQNQYTLSQFNPEGWIAVATGDVAAIPSGARIASAMLRFTGYTTSTVGRVYALQRNTGDFTESNSTKPTVSATVSTGTIPAGGTFSAPEVKSIDVSAVVQSWLAGQPNYGVTIARGSGPDSSLNLYSREHATVAYRPYLEVVYEEVPITHVNVVPPAMTLSLSTRTPFVHGTTPPINLSIATVTPNVIPGKTVRQVAPVMAESAAFLGGHLVNHLTKAEMLEMWLTPQDPYSGVRYPITVSGPAMELTVDVKPGVINLKTNRLSKTTPMSGTINFRGIFIKEADRYYKKLKTTIDRDDVWYEMEDNVGSTRAADSAYEIVGGSKLMDQAGYYFGSPEFRVDGPFQRRAVRFDGIDDYMVVGPYNNSTGTYTDGGPVVTTDMGLTIEFSIRTTTQNGTIFNGRGGSVYAPLGYNTSMTATPYPVDNDNKLVIENGKLTLKAATLGTFRWRTDAMIADGEWHHVIVSLPGFGPGAKNKAFIMVDGEPVMVRNVFERPLYLLPYAFMADAEINIVNERPAAGAVKEAIAGDLRDLIVRTGTNTNMSLAEGQRLYYEWSDAILIDAPVMTLSLSTKAPFKVKGNMKTMILLYGLGSAYEHYEGSWSGDMPMYTYFSQSAGYNVFTYNNTILGENGLVTSDPLWGANEAWHPTRQSGGIGFTLLYWEPVPFVLGEYLVYPVSITGEGHQNGYTGLGYFPDQVGFSFSDMVSAPGTTDRENFDDGLGGFYRDNKTGLPRFINLQKDLKRPLADFDVISVLNYPWPEYDTNPAKEKPVAEYGESYMTGNGNARPWTFDHGNRFGLEGMSQFDWAQARDKFRDSILQAAYDGSSLWIPEIHAAHHLGFIQGYETTKPGYWVQSYARPIWAGGAITNLGGSNDRAAQLDNEHGMAGYGTNKFLSQGDYGSFPQTNRHRRIVATEPGLTDGAYFEMGEMVYWYWYDEMKVHGYAYDLVAHPNGLQPGDLSHMSMVDWMPGEGSQHYFGNLFEKDFVLSAYPDGVAGKVIAREQEYWYGPRGQRYDNPHKNNVITIAAERGTLVRGKAIRGRAFLEFMDSYTLQDSLWRDAPGYTGDSQDAKTSTWHADFRRQKVIFTGITNDMLVRDMRFPNKTHSVLVINQIPTISDGQSVSVPYKSMNRRGLDWLAGVTSIPAGDALNFPDAMTLTLTAPDVKPHIGRNLGIPVTGVMRLDIEVRDAHNYQGHDRSNKALPMTLSIQMRGIGKTVKVVGPATLTLESEAPIVTVLGDRVIVYADTGTTITLFLKEDN